MTNNLRDLSTNTIKRLFEEQVKQLTMQTVGINNEPIQSIENHHARVFDFQLSGGWV